MVGWKATIDTPVSPISAKDRRRFLRAPVTLPVRFLAADGREFTGQTIDAAAGGACVCSTAPAAMGEDLILYIEGLGRIAGRVVRVIGDGFAISSAMAPAKRDKIADQLTWLLNRNALELKEERRALRNAGGGSAKSVRVAYDDMVAQCEILDVSVLGLALKTEGPRPMIGSEVQIGENAGVCARYIEDGFAVEFRSARARSAN